MEGSDPEKNLSLNLSPKKSKSPGSIRTCLQALLISILEIFVAGPSLLSVIARESIAVYLSSKCVPKYEKLLTPLLTERPLGQLRSTTVLLLSKPAFLSCHQRRDMQRKRRIFKWTQHCLKTSDLNGYPDIRVPEP